MGKGTTTSELKAYRKHQEEMLPIIQKQADVELEIRQKAFEQELKQTEELNLLANRLTNTQTQPVYVTQMAESEPTKADELKQRGYVYIGAAILGFLLLKGKL